MAPPSPPAAEPSYGIIQLRNLNMDPDWYLEAMGHRPQAPPLGIRSWLAALKEKFPLLRFGYFNPPLR